MKCVALLIAFAACAVVLTSADPKVRRVTGKYVTHIHHYKIPGKGRGRPGRGGKAGNCKDGFITKTAGQLNSGFQRLTSGVAGGLGANKKHLGLLGKIAGGVQTGLDTVAGGLNQAASDFFCGFDRVFRKFGSKVNKGDLIGGLVSGLDTFITGTGSFIGNLGTHALGAITGGVDDAVHGRNRKN